MNRFKLYTVLILFIIAALSGCSTINRFDEYDLTASNIILDMKAPPEPTVNVDYHVGYPENGNEILAIVQLGANLIKADEVRKAEDKLYSALEGLFIPEFIAELTYDRIVHTLNAREVDNFGDADVVLEVDIEEYGIESRSSNGRVSMVIRMQTRLFHKNDKQIVWQRSVSVKKEITPGLFGFHDIIGNVVTIASLGNLNEQQLADGFQKLTIEIMKGTVGVLQEDLREARYK